MSGVALRGVELWVSLSAPGGWGLEIEAESDGVNRGGESRPVVCNATTHPLSCTQARSATVCGLALINIPVLPIEAARIEADEAEPRQAATTTPAHGCEDLSGYSTRVVSPGISYIVVSRTIEGASLPSRY
jgi:hypothetical protein